MPRKERDLTYDTFFNGRIRVAQERLGYRFSIDAVILAHLAVPREGDRILDLGTGCGIIPLILAFKHPTVRAVCVEVQEALAQIARDNVHSNGMEGKIEIVTMDMRALDARAIGGPVDLVVANPPYRKARTGRVNPDNQRALARHEIAVTLSEVVDAGYRALKPKGRFVVVVPAQRIGDILFFLEDRGFGSQRVRMVHSRIDGDAKLVVAQGVKGGRKEIRVEAPLILYGEDGRYSGAASEMFNP